MEKIKLKIIKKKLSKKEFKKITIILKSENKISILASLSEKNIHKYFDKLIKSDHLELFTVSQKSIIGYAVLAKKPDYLIIHLITVPVLVLCFFLGGQGSEAGETGGGTRQKRFLRLRS